MTSCNRQLMQRCYEAGPAEKLAAAVALHAELDLPRPELPTLTDELDQLRLECAALARQMAAMDLGRLCGRCAARPGGGCCSAVMADNADVLQILINLLLGAAITARPDHGDNCCFLGPAGCLFPVKPIFCLNYNCAHILTGAIPADLAVLERRTGAVLSRQVRIETMLLTVARGRMTATP